MRNKPILIIPGDPNSVFFEIFFKSLKKTKIKDPLILISSKNLLKFEMRKLKFKKKIRLIGLFDLKKKLDNNCINLIDVKLENKKINLYIKNSFDIAFNILKKNLSNKLINGPINKSTFLDKKFLGITEYIANKFKIKKNAMLIYNKNLSVCPLTTHLPLKLVSKKINQNLIKEKTELLDDFFRRNMGFKPKIAVTGLNPHCESILKFNEDKNIIKPAIISLKRRGFKINGPFPADTIFLKQNRKRYNIIMGMYHDQVLSPIKSLKEYDAINITLGLPFYRCSPDHGPNEKMKNKNLSNPQSLINAIKFLDKR